MNLDRKMVETVFREYVSAYNAEDPKIKLKINHTYRVAGLCQRIAGDVGAPDVQLAWLTGMLHDIGRFEQVKRYHTFSDALSVDHAQFGADLLFRDGLLERFVPDSRKVMTQEERDILEKSIRNHSLFELPDGLSETELMYCRILRDADKIDIMRVNWETPLEDIYNVTTEQIRTARVTEEVKQCFRNKTTVLRPLKKTPIDHLVGHICLVFGLEYPISLAIMKEQGYLGHLLSFCSDDPETQEWFSYMRSELLPETGENSIK